MSEFGKRWQHNLEAGVLQLPRCTNCQAWNWYPLPACTHCQTKEFTWQNVATSGRLYSWTRVHRSFVKADIALPYIVALVELDDAPSVRLPCRLLDAASGTPRIGGRVLLRPAGSGADAFWGYVPAPAP